MKTQKYFKILSGKKQFRSETSLQNSKKIK